MRQLHAYTYSTSGLRSWFWREMRRKAYPAGAAGGFMLSVDPASKIGYLYSFVVRPRWRRRGFGRNMLDAAVEIAGRLNVEQMVFSVQPENTPAIRFYESAGAVSIPNPEPVEYPAHLGFEVPVR